MTKLYKAIVLGALLFLAYSHQASATIIDVDFTPGTLPFADGTNITNEFLDDGLLFSDSAAGLAGSFTSLGSQENLILDNTFYNMFRVDFVGVGLVTEATVTLGDHNLNPQTHSLFAFDSLGKQVDVDSLIETGLLTDTFDLTVNSAAGIATLLAYEQPFGAETLERISFTTQPVPLPTAAWLFGSGLIGLIGVARRKTRV